MNLPPIYLSAPDVGEPERQALLSAFDTGWIAPVGPDLDGFEADLCDYTGASDCLAVVSGTSALHLALILAGVKPGDEVVVQSATFAASAFAVCHAGAIPVFCDSEWSTWCLDPAALERFLIERNRAGNLPRAVMPVDLFGSVASYVEIASVCDRFGVTLVRDAAEALGSIGDDGHVGGLDCLSVVSFNGNKIITTSSGGALLGNTEQIERARYLSTQAREPMIHYEHLEVGYNYRLSNLLAAFGRAQLARLEGRIERRAEIAAAYAEAIPELDWCAFERTPRPNRWLTVGLMSSGDPLAICDLMQADGVHARPAWKPMHQQPVFEANDWIMGEGVADELFARGICLPSGSSMSDGDVERVVASYRHARRLIT